MRLWITGTQFYAQAFHNCILMKTAFFIFLTIKSDSALKHRVFNGLKKRFYGFMSLISPFDEFFILTGIKNGTEMHKGDKTDEIENLSSLSHLFTGL